MKWGRRRYQNEDGTLTEAGKARYAKEGTIGYRSGFTKRTEKRAAKLEAKGPKYEKKAAKMRRRAEFNADVDRKMDEYAQRQSTGKTIALKILTLGAYQNKAYQTAQAIRSDRATTRGGRILNAIMAYPYMLEPAGDVMLREAAFRTQERKARRAERKQQKQQNQQE